VKSCQDIKLAWQIELDTLVSANLVFGGRGSCCKHEPVEGDMILVPTVKPRTLSILKLRNYKALYTI